MVKSLILKQKSPVSTHLHVRLSVLESERACLRVNERAWELRDTCGRGRRVVAHVAPPWWGRCWHYSTVLHAGGTCNTCSSLANPETSSMAQHVACCLHVSCVWQWCTLTRPTSAVARRVAHRARGPPSVCVPACTCALRARVHCAHVCTARTCALRASGCVVLGGVRTVMALSCALTVVW